MSEFTPVRVELPLEPLELPEPVVRESSHQPYKQRFIGPERAALIVQLKRKNPSVTHQEIADAIGCSRPTVTEWLGLLELNTVPEARQLARSQALRATLKLADQVDHEDVRVSQGAAKAVVALAGVAETGPAVQVGVQVIVGTSVAPAGPDPFEVITTVSPSESGS